MNKKQQDQEIANKLRDALLTLSYVISEYGVNDTKGSKFVVINEKKFVGFVARALNGNVLLKRESDETKTTLSVSENQN